MTINLHTNPVLDTDCWQVERRALLPQGTTNQIPTSLVLFVLRAGKQAHPAFAGWPTEYTLRSSNREADWSVSWVMAVLMAVLDLIHKDREDGSAGGPSS